MRREPGKSSYLTSFCLGLLVSGFIAPLSPGDEEPQAPSGTEARGKEEKSQSDYLRFVAGEPGEGELQTSIVTLVGKGGVQVDIIAVVHVADGKYYRKLQKRFESYDSLLYEMIKPADVEPTPGAGGGGLLSFFQRGLKELLDLEFQLDGIDYSKKNFVHADLDPQTFFRLQRERGESILSLMFKLMRAELAGRKEGKSGPQLGFVQLALAFSSDDSARTLKYLLAQQMEHMEALIAGIEDGSSGEGSVIVVERNKVALKVLREKLDAGQRKLGIFYGGAHMPDMEKRLIADFELRRSKTEWLTAWEIRNRKKQRPNLFRGIFGLPSRSPGGGESPRQNAKPNKKSAPKVKERRF